MTKSYNLIILNLSKLILNRKNNYKLNILGGSPGGKWPDGAGKGKGISLDSSCFPEELLF